MPTGLAIALVCVVSQSPAANQANPAANPPSPHAPAQATCPTAPHSCASRCTVFSQTPFLRWCHPEFEWDWCGPHSFYGERVFVVEAVVFPPFGWGGLYPLGGGFGPVAMVPDPFYPPPVAARPHEQRAGPLLVPPSRDATADIPEQLVENLINRRRPTLAQRAQSARLEGAGDRMFRAGHFHRAAERYQQALGPTPDHDELKFKRAAALIAMAQYADADRSLREALRERPDWPFVPHDLRTLFPDAAIDDVLRNLAEQAAKPGGGDSDVLFLQAYVLYFSGRRDAAEPIFRNPPAGGSIDHFRVFQEAIARQRAPR